MNSVLKSYKITSKIMGQEATDSAMFTLVTQLARIGQDECALYILKNINSDSPKSEDPELTTLNNAINAVLKTLLD